jgi:hypothetical protein
MSHLIGNRSAVPFPQSFSVMQQQQSIVAFLLLESQDPEVEQHSSSTDGPTTKGPAMTEPTDKSRQARLAETEPTDKTRQARLSVHVHTKQARLGAHVPSDDNYTSSSQFM